MVAYYSSGPTLCKIFFNKQIETVRKKCYNIERFFTFHLSLFVNVRSEIYLWFSEILFPTELNESKKYKSFVASGQVRRKCKCQLFSGRCQTVYFALSCLLSSGAQKMVNAFSYVPNFTDCSNERNRQGTLG